MNACTSATAQPLRTCPQDAGDCNVEGIFRHFFAERNLFNTIPHALWSPPTDVYETPNSYVIRMEIPGIENIEEDVSTELNHNVLTIRGHRRPRSSDTILGFHQMEIHYGYFEKVVTLPHSIDDENLSGTYSNGFLCITIGKAEPPDPYRRRISIET